MSGVDAGSRKRYGSLEQLFGYPPDCIEKPGAEIGSGASLSGALRLRPRLCGGWGGWHGDQLGHLAEVLGGGGEEELVSCTVWTSQAQAIHSEDAAPKAAVSSTTRYSRTAWLVAGSGRPSA